MDKSKFAFGKKNYILIAVSVLIIITGFLLMTGPNCTNEVFEQDIFSVRRIKVAPVVCFIGFILMIVAIIIKPKDNDISEEEK
ncbi:MAG: DUF3098 domain-containing protein [Bacteroidaceae bacterium]|nr:DUF3098 domain-containing protein [Bacteroidaceae bacterium]